MNILDILTLGDELAAVEQANPDWRLHRSDEAAIWIGKRTPPLVTLRAATPEQAHHAIAQWEHVAQFRRTHALSRCAA